MGTRAAAMERGRQVSKVPTIGGIFDLKIEA